jgi:hypothetical protein
VTPTVTERAERFSSRRRRGRARSRGNRLDSSAQQENADDNILPDNDDQRATIATSTLDVGTLNDNEPLADEQSAGHTGDKDDDARQQESGPENQPQKITPAHDELPQPRVITLSDDLPATGIE